MRKPKIMKTIKSIDGYDEFGEWVSLGNEDAYKGLYAIGLDDPDTKKQEHTVVKAKVGLGGLTTDTGGLMKRIRSYYIAWPDGCWIYALLLTLDNDAKFLRKVEKEVHSLLEKHRYKSLYLTNLKKAEWFQCSIATIRKAFLDVKERYPDKLFVLFPSDAEPEHIQPKKRKSKKENKLM
jgi:hypothetical protein